VPLSAEELFHAARDLAGEAREDFLREACGSDRVLHDEVRALLRADDEAGNFLETPRHAGGPVPFEAAPFEPETQASRMIGRYRLLERIGEGGFGEVWMAEQTEPVRRRVALKLLKAGMDTHQLVARFEAERQALALMEHPGIARVFDAGATDRGRPYFVMELVRGVAITDYCDQQRLDIQRRLELFRDVCLAVQHAHQKGIIHRDIKPTNVLVTEADGRPAPKVIDFGIAKAMQGSLTDRTLFTEFRQMIGTPAYMSPEQAGMGGVDIDTRSDVYGLGVLLYELLTGTTPFSAEELMEAGVAEIHRIIREVEPTKPSTKLSTSEALPSIAAHRHTEPKRLGALVRGDLDWIVMRCLEKDRGRRYATASALAEDVRRHLAGEAVEAAPPSRAYRARKFVRRHRAGVLAAALVALALMVGISSTTWGLVWALDERDRADRNAAAALAASESEAQARVEAEASATRATAEAERAERELTRAREVKRFITEMLASVKPETAQGRDTVLLREILDGAARRIEAGEITDERIEAELSNTIGTTYGALGEYLLAEPFLQRALEIRRGLLGDEDPETLSSINAVGLLLKAQGRLAEAEAAYREALEGRRRVLGDDHPETLSSLNNIGTLLQVQGRLSEAEAFGRAALEGARRVLGDEHPNTLSSLNNMGNLLHAQGKLADAEPFLRAALEGTRRSLGDASPNTLRSMMNLGSLLQSLGKLSEAEALYREALESSRHVLGVDDPDTLNALASVGSLLQAQGRSAEAEPFFRAALEGRRRALGDDHPHTLTSLNNMGFLLQARGELPEAEAFYREALEGRRRVLGDDHPDTLASLSSMGLLLQSLGELSEAEESCRAALEGRRRLLGDDHPDTLGSLNTMGFLLQAQGRLAEAETFFREALEGRRRVLGDDHPSTLTSLNNLGYLLQAQGEPAEAEPIYRQALESSRRTLGDGHPTTLVLITNVGAVLNDLDRHAEALALLVESEAATRRLWTGGNSQRLGTYLTRLAEARLGVGDYDAAEAALLEAHPLLVEGFGATHERTLACVGLLVQLFEDWEKVEPDAEHGAKAAHWRERLVVSIDEGQ
jgi:tetratricopeptide (TPR) repeat protein